MIFPCNQSDIYGHLINLVMWAWKKGKDKKNVTKCFACHHLNSKTP